MDSEIEIANGVSIHAPTGGATALVVVCIVFAAVSIHAPTGGATKTNQPPTLQPSFNPRAHGGRDWRAARA